MTYYTFREMLPKKPAEGGERGGQKYFFWT